MLCAGVGDHRKTFDTITWIHAVVYKSKQPPSFFPDEFELWADAVLQHMGITRDHITAQNCRTVYLKLIQYSNVYGLS